jgi:D-lyxose ketol-isomerase
VEECLREKDISHDFVYAISDYYQALGMIEYMPNGKICIPAALWNSAKANFCLQNNISIHIDDDRHYLQYFSTPCGYYNRIENTIETQSGYKFNININPKNVLDNIEQILS